MFSNKIYNILKLVALVILPGLAAFYIAFAAIWKLPDAQQVAGSIAAINTFLGAVLHISSSVYKPVPDGKLIVDRSDPDKDVASLEFDKQPDLTHGRVFTLNIQDAQITGKQDQT